MVAEIGLGHVDCGVDNGPGTLGNQVSRPRLRVTEANTATRIAGMMAMALNSPTSLRWSPAPGVPCRRSAIRKISWPMIISAMTAMTTPLTVSSSIVVWGVGLERREACQDGKGRHADHDPENDQQEARPTGKPPEPRGKP